MGFRSRRDPSGDQGAVLVIVVIWMWLALLPMFVVFVVDVGNWFVHKRHLQLQADAGALAGGGLFTFPCSDAPIVAESRKYGGDPNSSSPYNLQVAPTDQSNVHVLVNSTVYWNEGGTDYSDGGPPCSARFVDLKITEATLPWFFGLGVVPAINAHARVEIQALNRARGALPVAVPDIDPKVGEAFFIDEASGAVLASTPLTKSGFSNGLAVWDNGAAPVSVPISASRIGVRIALGGGTSTTCGGSLVQCYDLGSANGILFVRGWSGSGSAVPPNPPLARSVNLFPGSCSDPYFTASATACSVGVAATVDFGGTDVTKVKVSAVLGGVEKQLQYDVGSGRWISTSAAGSFFNVNPNTGPLPVELKWEVNATGVTISGDSCNATGGNKCKGTFGTVQRVFSALTDRSGPIQLAQVWEGGSGWANSFQTGTTHNLVVKIGIQGNLQEAQSVSDPLVLLRVTGGSQNQSIDCDPAISNLRDEINQGCGPAYKINRTLACPAYNVLWSLPEPWECVKTQTGGAVGQVEHGMKDRILGGSNSCTAPINWPNYDSDDPRIVPLIITPFGTFSGSGNDIVPVIDFAAFYVVGWNGDPCPGAHVVPKGYIAGHFIKYAEPNPNGAGKNVCDPDLITPCVPVLTR
jgi:hypothetical protein